MIADNQDGHATRRGFLVATARLVGAAGIASVFPGNESRATPAAMQAAIKKVVGVAPLRKGKVTLDLPQIVENGNTVPLEVAVESAMTATDYVKAIHVFNEKNPQPNVISIRLGPRAGKGSVSTRMRLADSQQIVAIAEMSDGTFWSDTVDVVVTLAACLDEPV
jgi:sulfur-oxidizing protein SoxY